eukprot:6180156-Pleurochrysis_carterae.AAC.1
MSEWYHVLVDVHHTIQQAIHPQKWRNELDVAAHCQALQPLLNATVEAYASVDLAKAIPLVVCVSRRLKIRLTSCRRHEAEVATSNPRHCARKCGL